VRKQFALMRAKIDPSEFGGAPLLGVNGVAIISHGSANPTAIRNAIRAAANEQAIHRVNSDIIEVLAKIPVAGSTKPPESKGLKAMLARMRERLHRHPKDAEAPKKGEPDSPKLETEKEVTAESAAKNEVKPPVEIAPGPVSLNGGTAFAERLSKSAEPAERTAEETAVGADLAQKREEN
jgi:hypothetical protein